jgi:hypothetical protein
MKNLSKIVFPIIASSLLSLNSFSQDFLPGKFKGYQKRDLVPNYSKILCFEEKGNYLRADYFDLDNDSVFDVIELRPLKEESKRVVRAPFPIIYFFDNKGDYNLKCLFDPEMDGLNGNELIIEPPENYNRFKDIKL